MSYAHHLRVIAAGFLTLGLAFTANPVSAASMSHAYALHGSGQFGKSMASATVTRVSKGDFTLSIIAEHLPAPEMLHVKPARHAYVAWLIDGMATHSTMGMAAVGLTYNKQTGNYTGKGTVMIDEVTSVIVTAEPSARTHMPVMPRLTVLSSSGHGHM